MVTSNNEHFRGLFDIRSTTIIKAFILSALEWSLITTFCVGINERTIRYNSSYNSKYDINKNSWQSLSITFVSTFFAAMVIYALLFLIFGYGRSKLVLED
jgi:ABC-type phosphate/phosphonate transport system permease subunit